MDYSLSAGKSRHDNKPSKHSVWNLFAAFASEIPLEILHVPPDSQFQRADSLLGGYHCLEGEAGVGGMKHQKENKLLNSTAKYRRRSFLSACWSSASFKHTSNSMAASAYKRVSTGCYTGCNSTCILEHLV